MNLIIPALVFSAALALGRGFFERWALRSEGILLKESLARLRGELPPATRTLKKQRKRLLLPLWQRLLDLLEGRGDALISPEQEQKLVWAGAGASTSRFGAAKIASLGLGAVIFGLFFGLLMTGSLVTAFPLLVLGAGLGWAAPDAWLSLRLKARRGQVERELPGFVDLLSTCTRAGLSLDRAITRVHDEQPGILSSAFHRAIRAHEVGETLEEALEKAASRIGSSDVEAITGALMRARAYGTPISDVLSELGGTVQKDLREKARARAQRTGTMIILPMVVFAFPVTFMFLGYPAIMSVMHSLFTAGG